MHVDGQDDGTTNIFCLYGKTLLLTAITHSTKQTKVAKSIIPTMLSLICYIYVKSHACTQNKLFVKLTIFLCRIKAGRPLAK